MNVTQKQIADALGVSHAAVSQVLHGSRRSRISPQKQQEIRDLARSMGYRPRALTTHTIGYVLPIDELKLLGESNVLVHVEAALRHHGYKIVLVEFNNDVDRMREILNSKTVDGALLSRWYNGQLREILEPDLPWVLTSTENMGDEVGDRVTVDLDQTMRGIVRKVIDLGHKSIGLMTGTLDVDFHRQQWEALQATCSEYGGSDVSCQAFTALDEVLDDQLDSAFRDQDRPTVLIAGTPEKALIASSFLCRRQFRVPQDVSLVSLFDLTLFASLRPWLTATDAMGVAVVDAAVNRLMAKISDPHSAPVETKIPGKLILRDSLVPAKS